MAGRYSVLDKFTVTTPSLSVVIRADDTPLPSDLKAQPNPANLVTVHAVQAKESAAPSSDDAKAREVEAPDEPPSNIEEQQQAEAAIRERLMKQQRLFELQNMRELTQSQLKELQDLQQYENAMRAIEAQEFKEQMGFVHMLRRAESKHADMIYGRFGAPPPIKPLDAVVSEEDPEGFVKRLSTYETKDFTYWDKLRRHNTQTIIRRWHTYVPAGEEDTAFFERHIQASVPDAAYSQGIYYKQLDVGMGSAREYKLPTESYVAPPVYVRRTRDLEKRMNDPIRQMARNLYSCSTCASC